MVLSPKIGCWNVYENRNGQKFVWMTKCGIYEIIK